MHPAVGADHHATGGISMHGRPAYLDAVVGLGDAHIQDLTVRFKQLALAVCLPQLLLSQTELMLQLDIHLLQQAIRHAFDTCLP